MRTRTGATRPQHTLIVHHQSKYHCSIAYFDIFSLAVTLLQGGSPSPFFVGPIFFVFRLGWSGGPNPNQYPHPPTYLPACLPANLCDSLATECLPAAESSALQQPSSPLHYPTADPDRLAPPLPPFYSQAERSSQKLAPPPIHTLLCTKSETTAAPVCPQQTSCAPSPSRCDRFHGRRLLICVFFTVVLSVLKFADIVAGFVDDCFFWK